MIDLSRFNTLEQALIPFYKGVGFHKSRKFTAPVEDGWYKVRFKNEIIDIYPANDIDVIERVDPNLPRIKAYVYNGDTVIPQHFAVAQYHGLPESFTMIGLRGGALSSVEGVIWEDGNVYFIVHLPSTPEFTGAQIAFERNISFAGIAGITPEMKYLFLLESLKADSFRARDIIENTALSEDEKRKRLHEFKETIEERFRGAISRAGGVFLRMHKRPQNKFLVEYSVDGREIKTIIDQFMRVQDLGFCASGEDRRHSLSSAINLAKMYEEDGGVYITRQ